MKAFALFTALAVLACSPEKKVDRPNIDPGYVPRTPADSDDQCGDSSPGCPVDSMVVDSSQASIFRLSSWESDEFVAVDSSTYKLNWRFSGFVAGDTVQVKLVRDSVVSKVTRVSITKNRFTATGSVDIAVDKIFGTQASYSACTRLRKTTVKSEVCVAWKTNYPAKPPADSMWVDSSLAQTKLVLLPPVFSKLSQDWRFPSSKTNPGLVTAQQYGCVVLIALDGKARMLESQRTLTPCRKAYDALPASQKLAGYPAAYSPK